MVYILFLTIVGVKMKMEVERTPISVPTHPAPVLRNAHAQVQEKPWFWNCHVANDDSDNPYSLTFHHYRSFCKLYFPNQFEIIQLFANLHAAGTQRKRAGKSTSNRSTGRHDFRIVIIFLPFVIVRICAFSNRNIIIHIVEYCTLLSEYWQAYPISDIWIGLYPEIT